MWHSRTCGQCHTRSPLELRARHCRAKVHAKFNCTMSTNEDFVYNLSVLRVQQAKYKSMYPRVSPKKKMCVSSQAAALHVVILIQLITSAVFTELFVTSRHETCFSLIHEKFSGIKVAEIWSRSPGTRKIHVFHTNVELKFHRKFTGKLTLL